MVKFIDCKSYRTAKAHAPWASRIRKVEGGFMAFEFLTEYVLWLRQK